MKYLISLIIATALFSCNTQTAGSKSLQLQIDSLQNKLNNSYKPGFGEFMSTIQVHHAKLWFAGENQNWQLADFEIHEIKESLDGIKTYCSDRPETNSLGMIDAPIDSLQNAIMEKNISRLKSAYVLLTNTCNTCHEATAHGFNVIKIPTSIPFSNQEFKPVKQ